VFTFFFNDTQNGISKKLSSHQHNFVESLENFRVLPHIAFITSQVYRVARKTGTLFCTP